MENGEANIVRGSFYKFHDPNNKCSGDNRTKNR